MPDDISLVNYHSCENALQSALGGEPEPNLVGYLFRRTAAIQARDVELGYAAHRLHAARQKGQRIKHPVHWMLGVIETQRTHRERAANAAPEAFRPPAFALGKPSTVRRATAATA